MIYRFCRLLDYGGGIVDFSKEQYKRINGFSNQFFGWGGEDDDLYTRYTVLVHHV